MRVKTPMEIEYDRRYHAWLNQQHNIEKKEQRLRNARLVEEMKKKEEAAS